MRKNIIIFLVGFLVLLGIGFFLFVGSPGKGTGGPTFIPQGFLLQEEAALRKIVVFQPGTADYTKTRIVESAGAKVIKKLRLINAAVIHLPEAAAERAKAAILSHAPVVRIDDDLIMEAFPKPPAPPGKDKKPKPDTDQPPETFPWGMDRIEADFVWPLTTGNNVKVAVLDTGIDITHPDLMSNIKGGINTINPRKSYKDDNGHGTHVAGTIAALDNDIGVVGVAPDAHLYAIKVLDRNGNGWLSDIIEGLEWCINNNMQVINMSLGSTSDNLSFHEAIYRVYKARITQVASAGNDSNGVRYPAGYEEVVAVSAVDQDLSFPIWCNYGEEIDVTAPGVDINSTYKDSTYKIMSGTSMAAPHVSGLVALKLQLMNLNPDEMMAALKISAEDIGLPLDKQGTGLVDAEALIYY